LTATVAGTAGRGDVEVGEVGVGEVGVGRVTDVGTVGVDTCRAELHPAASVAIRITGSANGRM
jgi:hypothetical protein